MQEVHRYACFAFNAIGEPGSSVVLNVLRVAGLLVPGAFIGASLGGVTGLFYGMAAAEIFAGAVALLWGRRRFGAGNAVSGR